MAKKNGKKSDVPDYALDSLARFLLPAIQRYYETEEGKRDYEAWRAQRQEKLNMKKKK